MNINEEYIRVVKARFNSVKELGDKTFQQLSKEELLWSLNKESNSIAVIIKHISGNMISRWTDFLITDGEKKWRNRDEEFKIAAYSKAELIEYWDNGWRVMLNSLTSLKEEDLLKKVYIRGEGHLVIEAIERQLAHYSYHVGQIVYIAKQIKGSEWSSLSIPKGKSEEFKSELMEKHRDQ
ncbi:hypothetical protein BpOF4_18260 [Alkalihalophilus pseudofirmus OF4]|uniref:DUF1572 domain-containing protein n=1 Tax=Alkalihalophilus pseudofirmus (strain ATCC BAA-2126 / JCM 17055 / OF4) TaxID=398511 RepID=D3FS58_ALKPO|nr:DUF1572 family protein [Alkalihalophilus pseudofirmus]ADC51693.1 hypothetical protein BpOF4_18260 [Alkalihalophilus pseudofirmus OF4]